MWTPSARLLITLLALMFELAQLTWELLHGGIRAHHPLMREDLPAISNAWGVLILPQLAWWAGRGLPPRPWGPWAWAPFAAGFALALALGAAMATAFGLQAMQAVETIFLGVLLLAALLPAYRPECLLGYVLGMSWAFGAVLPTLVGGVVAAASWLLHAAARRAFHLVVRP